MPVYKKGKKWRVVVRHKGMRQDFILDGTKEEAKQFEAAKKVEARTLDPSTAGRSAPTLSVFCEGAYKAHAERHLKERTWSNRTYTLANLQDRLGDLKLTDLHTGEIEAYKNARLDEKIGASTINDELKVLRTVLAYARELGVPVASPKIKDIPTRGVKRKSVAWTAAQVDLLLTAIRERAPELEGLVVFLLNTGCRKGEALALEWRCVDLKRRLIRIEPSVEWQPKDGESREIPISDALLSWLERPGMSVRWVFPSRRRERYAFWPQRAFDAARKKAKVPGSPHACRHTFSTHFLRGRPDLFLLAKLLGHSHAYVTELYSHLLPDHLSLARNVVSLGAPPPHVADAARDAA